MEIEEVLAHLAQCLCAQILGDGSPETCFCGVLPGEVAVLEYTGNCASGKCGMAWVRLINIYPSAGVGVQDTTPGNCGTGLGFDVEMGIVRCLVVPPNGRARTMEESLAATQQQVKDARTIRSAILCCSVVDPKDMILGPYSPIGPSGEMLGGSWIVNLAESPW